jgi:metal-responsive CopG/Arc/MetJ family transcriptional regulator
MKTAVSIPDEVFEGAERLAKRTKKSRSRLFSDAVREYLARHAPEEVTAAMDRVCAELGNSAESTSTDDFVASAARRTLKQSEW